ncbi:hypothetical protein [Oryzibacter oryziterrae]|uniref:hypothetical protein n=1 Tax=Oryzibacter oryziterrae TaxID=2766474 RepID=UPI001F304602|nr:hypothetical protein [Oryzibacter oryziterrae]
MKLASCFILVTLATGGLAFAADTKVPPPQTPSSGVTLLSPAETQQSSGASRAGTTAATMVGYFSGQNYVGTLANPTTLYTVPAKTTVYLDDVTVWGGAISPGRTCMIALYCSNAVSANLNYYVAQAGKSDLYSQSAPLICKAGGKITAYTYTNNNYDSSVGCDDSTNHPWLIVRGRSYR